MTGLKHAALQSFESSIMTCSMLFRLPFLIHINPIAKTEVTFRRAMFCFKNFFLWKLKA